MTYDLIIVGAGPAGWAAAIAAGGAGRRVRICERMPRPGLKLLATGGGRCNVTHSASDEAIQTAFGRQGRFMKPALAVFGPSAIRAWLAGEGVPTVVQPDGCVFPASQRARDVLDALMRAAGRVGVDLCCGCEVRALHLRGGRVAGVETARGTMAAHRVILAAGGCGYPALGADGSGFELARQAGIELIAPTPALVPLVTVEEWPRQLAGLVVEQGRVRIEARGCRHEGATGPVLFTHDGISGPPVLDLSGEVELTLSEDGVHFSCHRVPFDFWRKP